MRCFPLAAFKAFLCIVFRSLIITYVGVGFFGFILFEVLCVVESVGLYLSPDLGIFHSFFFFLITILILFSWNNDDINVRFFSYFISP